MREQVAGLEAKLAELNEQFMAATEEKNEAIAQADKTQSRANMGGCEPRPIAGRSLAGCFAGQSLVTDGSRATSSR